MDVSILTTFLVPFLPYLLKVGEKATEEAGKKVGEKFGGDAWEKAKSLWAKLSPKVEAKAAAIEAAIVSGGYDGTVRLWNSQGQPLGEPFKGHQGYVHSVAISTDGKTIVSGGYDGTVRLWDIRLDTWLKAACERLKDHPVFTKPESADEKEAKATCQPYLR